jgi:hypothetical protein
LYLDGTAGATGTAELPALIRGATALRISSAGAKLVRLPDPPANESVERRRFELRVTPGGRIDVRGWLQSQGVTAPAWRARYQAASTRRDRVQRDLADDVGLVELAPGAAGLKLFDLDSPEQPVRIEIRGGRAAPLEGGAIRLSMGPAYRLTTQYASLQKRSYPVVLGPRRTSEEIWTLKLAAGHSVGSLPTPVKLDSPFGTYERTVERTATEVTVRSTLVLRAARVAPEHYAAWRKFAQSVDSASGPSLALSP